MIYAAPSASFEAIAQGFATGLTGTIGVTILDGIGGTTTARSTSGIVETPASSGIYTATLTAPSSAGQYVLVWDDGSGVYASEALTVNAAGAPAAVSATALVTLAQVRAYIGKPSGDTGQDSLLTELIGRATLAFQAHTGRKLGLDASSSTRTYELTPYDAARRLIRVDDLSAAPSSVVTKTKSDTTVTTYTVGTDLLMRPYNRETWEPITAIEVRPSATGLSEDYIVEVTGTFGWPAVPDDVQQAALQQVRTWWRRDVANTGTGDVYAPEDAGSLERPMFLANEVKKALVPYTRTAAV